MEKLIINGRTFVEVPATSYGDYGGDGSVGRANLNILRDQFKNRMVVNSYSVFDDEGRVSQRLVGSPSGYVWEDVPSSEYDGVDLVILEGDYSSESAYLAEDCEEFNDIISALATYPVLDDDELAKVEFDWRYEAIRECVRDLSREMRQHGETIEEMYDALNQEQAEELIRQAMSAGNIEPHYEYSSAYISADDVAPHAAKILSALPIKHGFMFGGEFVSLPDEEEPDLYETLPTSSTSEYVAAYCAANHLKA